MVLRTPIVQAIYFDGNRSARCDRAVDRNRTLDHGSPMADVEEAYTLGRKRGIEAMSVVGNSDGQCFGAVVQRNADACGAGMLYNIVEAFLDDAVEDEAPFGRQEKWIAFYRHLRFELPGPAQHAQFPFYGFGQVFFLYIIGIKRLGNIAQIINGCIEEAFGLRDAFVGGALAVELDHRHVELGEAKYLAYIIVQFLGKAVERLLLGLQLGLHQFLFEIFLQ